jgi:hypothetical protein
MSVGNKICAAADLVQQTSKDQPMFVRRKRQRTYASQLSEASVELFLAA